MKTAAEQHLRQYAGRCLIDGTPTDLILNIPPGLISKLPQELRDTFDFFMIDYAKNKSINGSRILRELANGGAEELKNLFAELAHGPEAIPPMAAIEQRIKEGIARFTEANPKDSLVSATDFLAEAIVEAPMTVPPFFPDPGRLVVTAFSGVGKTNLILNMGGAISGGRDFLGWQAKKKTVLFIDGENPRAEIQRRARSIFKTLGADSRNIHFAFPQKRIDLLKDKGLKDLERMITATGAGVAILDSFLNFFPVRNENDSSEVRPALDRITALTRSLRCSVVIVDHTMKPLRESRGSGTTGPPTPRGSGAKVDWSDATIALEEKKAEGRILRTLYFTKVRTCAPIPPAILELDGRLVFSRVGEDSLVPIARIVEIVKESPGITSGRLVKEIRERLNVSERSVYRALDRAVSMDGAPISRKVLGSGNHGGRGFRTEYFPASPTLPGIGENA
jgi:hypothetical protein